MENQRETEELEGKTIPQILVIDEEELDDDYHANLEIELKMDKKSKSMSRLKMTEFGLHVRQSMMRSSALRNNLYKQDTATGQFEQSFLAMKSNKLNFDHLALRDQSSKAYKKVNGIIRSKAESIYSKMVYSDYMYKYDADMEKTKVIVLISDISLYVMSLGHYSVINHVMLKDLQQILAI